MLDIEYIRDHRSKVEEAMRGKHISVDINRLLELDSQRREATATIDSLRKQRNDIAALAKQGKPSPQHIAQGKEIKAMLAEREKALEPIVVEYETLLKQVPNVHTDDTPFGLSEVENQEVAKWGELPKFDFAIKNHWEIAERKGWIDKERAAKIAMSRFAYIMGDLALLDWALMRFGADQLTNGDVIKQVVADAGLTISTKPFTLVLPPFMIRTAPYDGMDRLEPRAERYKIEDEDLWLQGSAEHVLGSMHADEIFEEKQLPIRYAGYATSFRREAGTYGKDMEGILRMHQFEKLEMESFSRPEDSLQEHYLMIALQEHLMQQLKLPYRKLLKCTADIGKPNARGVDLEVWLPGQSKYRETHTADYMTDYQARRLQTRFRREINGDVELIHTNDATAFSQRPLIAIIENFQTESGDVIVPEVLRPYMHDRELI